MFFRIKIFVADRNDNSPVFEEKSYVFSAPESSRPGHVIGSVQARDDDKGRNGEIEYRLRTTIKKFAIEATSGEMTKQSSNLNLKNALLTINFD